MIQYLCEVKTYFHVCLGCICSARKLSTFQLQITIVLGYFKSLSAEKNLFATLACGLDNQSMLSLALHSFLS